MLNVRLYEQAETAKVLSKEQNGFCMDRRANNNMFGVDEMIERQMRDGNQL